METLRTEIPDPSHHRPAWRTLNGPWQFAIDDEVAIRPSNDRPQGHLPGAKPRFTRSIMVPFCPQSELSGVGLTGDHSVLWYRKQFTLEENEREGRVFITFGAVDFACSLWINGEHADIHRGGYTPFRTEITELVSSGENEILLRVVDARDRSQPRGKQSWQAPFNCWYRESSGIWQSVWLEFTPSDGIDHVRTVATVTGINASGPSPPDAGSIDRGSAHLEIVVRPLDPCRGTVAITVSHNGEPLRTLNTKVAYPATVFHLDFEDIPLWSSESPEIFDLEVAMTTPSGTDSVHTYVGFRRVTIVNGKLHLNGRELYQRLILDQGYWPEGHYTAPDDEAIRKDIQLAMRMGFNGCRKHAKIEDPRFYYWADRLGFLVWEELPSAYEFTPASQRDLREHTLEMIRRDTSHPAVIAWTLFNESWGVPDLHSAPEQQTFVRGLIEMVRMLDPERLVVGNDGWEQVGGDVYGLHSYASTPERLERDLDTAFPGEIDRTPVETSTDTPLENGRFFRSRSALPEGRLQMVTEFGGTAYRPVDGSRSDAWGYDNPADSPEDLLQRINTLVNTIRSRSGLAGFVYTQLTDVEQEVNGLLFSDRSPKIEIEALREVIIREI